MFAVARSFPYPARKQVLHSLDGVRPRDAGALFNGVDAPLRRAVIAASVREALRQHKATPSEISRYAIEGGVWKVVQPYLEAMTANV
jgi:hypothetical protein